MLKKQNLDTTKISIPKNTGKNTKQCWILGRVCKNTKTYRQGPASKPSLPNQIQHQNTTIPSNSPKRHKIKSKKYKIILRCTQNSPKYENAPTRPKFKTISTESNSTPERNNSIQFTQLNTIQSTNQKKLQELNVTNNSYIQRERES